jgi:methionyl-tRNA formyltransferase
MSVTPFRIIFFGTPDFASASLEAIVAAGLSVVCVVTAVDKPAGRGQKISESAVKKTALALKIPILQPTNLKAPDFIETMSNYQADLGVVIAFRMLPEVVWSMPRLGTINLHGSLLPNYRGAAPIHHAIINGESTTGVTTFFLKHEIDTGDIISSTEIAVSEEETLGELHDRMMIIGATLMVDTLRKIQNNEHQSHPQPNITVVKSAPKLNRDFCELNFDLNQQAFHNKLRGLSPSPGAWMKTTFGDMKLFRGRRLEKSNSNQATGIEINQQKLIVHLYDGDYEILELQPAGKPKMLAKDFINGLKK